MMNNSSKRSKPRISLIHPTGNPNSRHAALALAEVDLLQEIITTLAYNPNGLFARYLYLLPEQISRTITHELSRRTWTSPKDVPIKIHPKKELLRLSLLKTRLSRLNLGSQGLINWVQTSLDRHVAKYHLHDIDAVYAYEDTAAETFHAAKQRGIFCLYELPILFYRLSREIQEEEAERFPELAISLQATQESACKIERKEQEIQLADYIFVPSSMTKKSLVDTGVSAEKISVIPYGSPINYFQPQVKPDRLFRALFVGRVGPRKGVHYLLQAWRDLNLPDAELLIIGVKEFPEVWLRQYQDTFRYIPSISHNSLNQYYSAANVFVFPSLVEGFGLVLLEAMACGIPVIATSHTAAVDIITDGKEGFIIPIRDVEALKEKLEWCYQHPLQLAEMGRAARQKAEQLSWSSYRQKLASKVLEVFNCL